MKLTLSTNVCCAVVTLLFIPTRLCAAESWSCVYAGFNSSHSQIHSKYRVSDRLFKEVDTSDVPFYILENSHTAIVAARGGSLAGALSPEYGLMIGGTILIIKKDTGDFLLGNVEWRSRNPVQQITSGTCHRGSSQRKFGVRVRT